MGDLRSEPVADLGGAPRGCSRVAGMGKDERAAEACVFIEYGAGACGESQHVRDVAERVVGDPDSGSGGRAGADRSHVRRGREGFGRMLNGTRNDRGSGGYREGA